jgi:hypothetical protein
MAAPTLTFHGRGGAAKRRLAVSSVAPVAFGYERSLRSCEARFSRPATVACSGGDRE